MEGARTAEGELATGSAREYISIVTSATIIEQIKQLSPEGQSEVIQFAFELAQNRQLTAAELGELAERLADSEDPAEKIRLRSAMIRGFYGE